MSYTVLARRYRSQTFDDVVGQEAIARTLTNAIEQDRVAHAYLFVGTRGVGKTSMARIFAKALAGGSEEADAAIMSGQDTDVIEIDAASNNSVENARDLIANAGYRPMRGRSKVYIIDEVHMLSTSAFNALLKTLEEPPGHVKFILCTTDVHKVPPTIQSRCQRFDFQNIASGRIADHLAVVAESEGSTCQPELIAEIARLANGSMRDGLSILDRVLAAATPGETVTLELLETLLGLPDRALIGALLDSFADQDPKAALEAGDALLAKGIAIDQVFLALVGRLRECLLLRTCGSDTGLVETQGDARDELIEQSGRFEESSIVHMIAIVENVQRTARQSLSPRALFDAVLVRLALTEHVADVAGLLRGGGGVGAPGGAPKRPAKKA